MNDEWHAYTWCNQTTNGGFLFLSRHNTLLHESYTHDTTLHKINFLHLCKLVTHCYHLQ
jgi:hypothetical protein